MKKEKVVFCMNKNINIEFKVKKMEQNPDIYWVYLKREGKELEIRDFSFGVSEPELEIVLESISEDYKLFLASPTLESFIENLGDYENIKESYDSLKQYIKDCLDFFTEKELQSLCEQY